MTIIQQALRRARQALGAGGIDNPGLESELLMRHTLHVSRVQLYLELERELDSEQHDKFWYLVNRRASNEPAAYITGHREFYGLDFYVDPDVLIPRPETELLVEKTIELFQKQYLSTIAEVGTGSGAIAISLALSLPQARIYATDLSPAALKVTRFNCQKHGVAERIQFFKGNLLEPLPGPVDLIVANLPYVRESELANSTALCFEPVLALNGGRDGLDTIRQLCHQVNEKLNPGGYLLLEIGQGQGPAVTGYLRSLFPEAAIELIPDFAGIDRVVCLRLSQDSTKT
ncbi:MAG: peptide chain release factor N(5)-glutamine methyltransferase [Chloroflexi bacterium]|nr:peptide chain release factor N(5)-glutamine methyltransferase [Chloroflexota bacterium]